MLDFFAINLRVFRTIYVNASAPNVTGKGTPRNIKTTMVTNVQKILCFLSVISNLLSGYNMVSIIAHVKPVGENKAPCRGCMFK